MTRLALLALYSLLLAGIARATPAKQEALAPVETKSGWSYTDCGLPTDVIQIESIEVSPDPPEKGKDLTVKVIGTASDVIEDGAYADVTVKLGLVKLLQKRFDVCEEARNANASIQCPVEEGQHIVEQTVTLPNEIPNALFRVNVRGYTKDEEDMVCVDLAVDFRNRPFLGLW
ncbi:hypothetical protein PUNSTDRAFT_80380 [Punctularia strigosozonata HHB-11173 SS5]|uniref:uncharacterized protein n=1 Tax=Punctularia strigosozonata (strain HHB-11173) TaxID=741275 RepID=UPI0004417DCD|nr:uncharacterized protein PUNSTDRAFT_80380 [Punctularia strigosozonata HHB-11173 SS5]EIN14211.1 hypothetical protein PUNSTDRAFT_80380 [Punctularia strigosozonata HHB-11173 SS5]